MKMSSTFSGFTETDIRKLNAKPKRELRKVVENQSDNLDILESKPRIEVPQLAFLAKIDERGETSTKLDVIPENETPNITEVIDADSTTPNVVYTPVKVPIDLSDFELKQRLIEEQNRVRKKHLMRMLADKSQKTQEEFKKLQIIQEEVNKLDNKLSNDVHVLRRNIDGLSLTYMTAEKRFHKLEREYLEAKLSLQKLQEKKELLTEHLCTLIVKNEERKADKLKELLELLDINESEAATEVISNKIDNNNDSN